MSVSQVKYAIDDPQLSAVQADRKAKKDVNWPSLRTRVEAAAREGGIPAGTQNLFGFRSLRNFCPYLVSC